MLGNRGLLSGLASSYIKSFTEKLHKRPYMVTTEGVSGTKHFYWVPLYGIRSFHASFHNFLQCFYIDLREMPTKVSDAYLFIPSLRLCKLFCNLI